MLRIDQADRKLYYDMTITAIWVAVGVQRSPFANLGFTSIGLFMAT